MREDLSALCALLRERRPGVRIIALAPAVSPDAVIAALGARVSHALPNRSKSGRSRTWRARRSRTISGATASESSPGAPHWLTLRSVVSYILTADRLVRFTTELQAGVVDDDRERDLLMTAFREMLLNAMEHGGGFDPEQVIEVTAARTARAIINAHLRDPGPGFDPAAVCAPCGARRASPKAVMIATALHRAETGLRPGGSSACSSCGRSWMKSPTTNTCPATRIACSSNTCRSGCSPSR